MNSSTTIFFYFFNINNRSTYIFTTSFDQSINNQSIYFIMPSIRSVLGAVVVGLLATVTALPAAQKLSPYERRAYEFGQLARKHMLAERQNPATGLPDGLTDVDILELYVSHLHHHLVQIFE